MTGVPRGRVGLATVALAAVAALGGVLLLLTRESSGPAGDLLAYGCAEHGNQWFAICVVSADGRASRQLTRGLEASDPSWSPDGDRIVFTRHRSAGQRVTFRYDELYVVDADGDGLRQLTRNRAGLTLAEPAWSPDGGLIALVRGRTLPSAGVTLGAIAVVNEDGTGVRRITSGPLDTSPAWSPDGRTIAFTRTDGYGSFGNVDVYVVRAGAPRRLTTTSRRLETEPAWSPEGRRIAFLASSPETEFHGRAALHVLDLRRGRERRVASLRLFSRYAGNLSWSPDGRTIALELSTPDGCTTVAVVRVDAARARPRALLPCSDVAQGAWAPAWRPAAGEER